jgi:tetratricopeptide (TPR) repeat protein
MTISAGRALHEVARLSLTALAFLVPLTALPWTSDVLDFNKNIVFVVLSTVAALSWVGGMVAEREMSLKAHWLFILPLLLIGGVALSSAFSLSPFTSWLGEGGQEYVSFVSTLLFVIFFIVGSHLFGDLTLRKHLLSALFIGSGLLGLGVLLSFVGLNLGLFSNTIGVPTALALYFLIMTVLGNGVWLATGEDELREQLPSGIWGVVVRGGIVATSLAALLLLISLDSLPLWLLTFLGLLPLFAFVLALPKDFSQPLRFVIPMLLLVAALLFSFFPTFLRNPYPLEVSPSLTTSLDMTKAAWSDHSWLLGSGPGTFSNVYTKFMPESVNDTVFWDTRFDRGSSHVLSIFTMEGLLGGLIYIVFLGSILVLSVGYLLRSRVHGGWKYMYGPFAAWLVVAGASFILAQNFTLTFLLIFLSAFLAAQALPAARGIAFAKSPRLALASAFVFMLLGVGMLMILFVSLSRYSAEVAFAQASSLDRSGGPLDEIIPLLNKAATRNRWNDGYYRNLGSALLLKAADLAKKEETKPEELQSYVAAAINSGLQATNLAPLTVSNWDLRGNIYREFSPVVQNANDFAIASYNEAIKLAPNNPKYQVGLARTYIVRADLLRTLIEGEDKELAKKAEGVRDEALTKAKEALDKALVLKGDYTQASYYLAFVHERQGNLADAVKSMELVKAINPNDIGVSMQLSLLYLRQGKNDLAKTELERSLTIAPTFANARWYLSVIYEDEGDKAKAIEQLKKIQETDPDNSAVKQRIERLEKNQPTEEVIPPPIDEIPPPADSANPSATTTGLPVSP